VNLFNDNFAKFADHVDQAVLDSAPKAGSAASAPKAREAVVPAA
jgi:hypothetical protein